MAKAERTERLTREIQSAKMELAQIRARHPEPRLTLDEASQFCDDQMERFIALSETKDDLAAQSVAARERADKEETKMRSLREELMKKEREVEKAKAKQLAGEAPMLPDRCVLVLTSSISMHPGFCHFCNSGCTWSWLYCVLTSLRPAGSRTTRSFSRRTPGSLPFTKRPTTKCVLSSVLRAFKCP
jgi:hypothetical protein